MVPFISLHLWRFCLEVIMSFYVLLVLDVDRKKKCAIVERLHVSQMVGIRWPFLSSRIPFHLKRIRPFG